MRSSPATNLVKVRVYRISGRQLFFNVSGSICEECDLAVAAVARAVSESGVVGVDFRVEPWLNRLPIALLQGAYHPPITLVDGKVVSQGAVPDVDLVRREIVEASRRTNGRE